MTPKKEAENLINEYRMILMNENTECGNEILCTLIAKKCALVTVNEILNELFEISLVTGSSYVHKHIDYYQEVKNQINKL